MIRKITGVFLGLCFGLFLNAHPNDDFTDRVKIALREVGNQLLLKQQDSTSLILPVKQVDDSVFRLSFQNNLLLVPDDLVLLIKDNLKTAQLPVNYRVEVKQCNDDEVAYSYQMSQEDEQTIIPCQNRTLPQSCYYLDVKFIDEASSKTDKSWLIFVFGAVTLVFVMYGLLKPKFRPKHQNTAKYVQLGSFKFYEDQNKLIKEAEEITLSKKECELLAIFVARPNEIITREELTKKVWEDNGVVVGRSLDTFISKLRKKFKNDDSIKLTNVHGVGYKLELF